MKYFIILILSTFCIPGCVTTTQITSADQYEEISAQGRQYGATITVQVDTGAVDYEGNYITVRRDSARWIDPQTGVWHATTTATLHRVRFAKHFIGALEGLVICAVPAAVLSVFVNGSFGDHNQGTADPITVILWGGAVVGTTYGATAGHRTEYVFNNNSPSR
jgi:hypothetical protein